MPFATLLLPLQHLVPQPLAEQQNATIIRVIAGNKGHYYSHLVSCHVFPGIHLAAYSGTGTSALVIGQDMLWAIIEPPHKPKALAGLLQHGKIGRAESCRARG